MEPNLVNSSLVEDFKRGMLQGRKSIPPKYFYDDVGSRLFDQICDLPEYYPTRIESGLLKNISTELIDFVKPDCLTELGSGASRKPSTCLMLVIGRTTVCFMSQLTCARRCLTGHQIIFKKIRLVVC